MFGKGYRGNDSVAWGQQRRGRRHSSVAVTDFVEQGGSNSRKDREEL